MEELGDDVNDIMWYFEDSSEIVTKENFIPQSCSLPPSVDKDTTWYTNNWLCTGLSNSRICDYYDILYPHDNCKIPPLHMRLAQSVAEVLWISAVATSANLSFLQQRKTNEQTNHSECAQEKLHLLTILTISGKAIEESKVTSNAVAISIKSDQWFAIYSIRQPSSIGDSTDIVRAADFFRTIIWMTEDEVSMTSPLGSSLQARHTSTVVTVSVEEFIHQSSHNMLRISSAIDRLAESLGNHDIELLLCSPSVYSDQLATACKIRHIAVLSMRSQELSAASLLCQATPVEDILYLEEEWVGKRPIRIRALMHVPQCKGNSTTSRIERHSAFHLIDDDDDEGESIETEADINDDRGEDVVLSLELREHCCNMPGEHLPVSVVICGLTAISIRTVFNSFLRSLYQLGSIILCQGSGSSSSSRNESHSPLRSGVMPGGGIPELLTAIHLQHIAQDMEFSNVRADAVATHEQSVEVSSLLRKFASALVEYPRKNLLAHGLTYPQTEVQLERSISQLRYICSAAKTRNYLTSFGSSSGVDEGDVLSALRTMSDEEKRDLPVVIPTRLQDLATVASIASKIVETVNEGSGDNNALDVAVLKEEALRTAVSVIRHLFRPLYKI